MEQLQGKQRPTGERKRRLRTSHRNTRISDSYNYEQDEVDDSIEPENLDEKVIELAENGEADLPEDFTPANRMKQVNARASNYEREYRLKLLHRLLMRNVPLDQIAQELDVSVHTVIRDRKELYSRLRQEAKKMDTNELIGDTLGFYNEVQAVAMRMASASNLPVSSRLASLRTALASKGDSHKFMSLAGVFDVLKFRKDSEESSDDITKLMAMTERLLSSDEEDLESVDLDADLLPMIAQMDEEEEEVRLL